MKILKFGGTSVGSSERIRSLLPIINSGERKIVVFSAMSGTTNVLTDVADAVTRGDFRSAAEMRDELKERYRRVIGELFSTTDSQEMAERAVEPHFRSMIPNQEMGVSGGADKIIMAQGELITTQLINMFLNESGVNSYHMPALNYMRVDKDGDPDYYYISENIVREMARGCNSNTIVTEGYICRNAFGETDNLKRGGSDYTASIIGSVIGATEVQIWTDISGFRNNDPRYVDNTSIIRELSFDEAAELAYFGAKILHPSTINPARMKGIPVVLKNSMEPDDPGTVISSASVTAEYKAVAAKDSITVIRITSGRMLMSYGFMRKVFEIFELYRTPIDMVATSEVSLSLTVDMHDNMEQIKGELSRLGNVEIEHDQTIICVVGDFRPEVTGAAPEIFQALNRFPVKMISYGASPNSISIIIDSKDKEMALRELHQSIF